MSINHDVIAVTATAFTPSSQLFCVSVTHAPHEPWAQMKKTLRATYSNKVACWFRNAFGDTPMTRPPTSVRAHLSQTSHSLMEGELCTHRVGVDQRHSIWVDVSSSSLSTSVSHCAGERPDFNVHGGLSRWRSCSSPIP